MDFIRPIGPVERDIEPVYRVERAHDESEREEQQREQRKKQPEPESPARDPDQQGPVEGDDGHLHIDIRA